SDRCDRIWPRQHRRRPGGGHRGHREECGYGDDLAHVAHLWILNHCDRKYWHDSRRPCVSCLTCLVGSLLMFATHIRYSYSLLIFATQGSSTASTVTSAGPKAPVSVTNPAVSSISNGGMSPAILAMVDMAFVSSRRCQASTCTSSPIPTSMPVRF